MGLTADVHVVITKITHSAAVGAFAASGALIVLVVLWHIGPMAVLVALKKKS
jgi:hypothetical protein